MGWLFGRKSAVPEARPFVPAWLTNESAEVVVGSRGAAIASPSGGATIDAEVRTAVSQIPGALRTHGLIDA